MPETDPLTTMNPEEPAAPDPGDPEGAAAMPPEAQPAANTDGLAESLGRRL